MLQDVTRGRIRKRNPTLINHQQIDEKEGGIGFMDSLNPQTAGCQQDHELNRRTKARSNNSI